MKLTLIASLNFIVFAPTASSLFLRGSSSSNGGGGLLGTNLFSSPPAVVAPVVDVTNSVVEEATSLAAILGDTLEIINNVTWEIVLLSDTQDINGTAITCTDPALVTSVIPLYDFIKASAELTASQWLTLNGVLDIVWRLADVPDSEGPITDRRLKVENEAHRSLARIRHGYFFYSKGSCPSCGGDNGDQRRKLGDSEGQGTHLSDAIAKNLKQSLEQQCAGLTGLSQVRFDVVTTP